MTLDLRDFAGFIGANPKPDAPPRPRLLPDQPYDLEGLRVGDADIRFRSDNIDASPNRYTKIDKVLFKRLVSKTPFALGLGQDSPYRALLDAARKKEELSKARAK